MVRRTSYQIETQVIKDYNEGVKFKDIISKYPIGHSTIDSILRRNENKLVRRRTINTPLIRFMNAYIDNGSENCYLWIKSKYNNGYGRFEVNGKYYLAHRVSYEHYYGYKPSSKEVVMHKCDNPSCVNPFHLSLGSQKDNIQDMRNKGRGAFGEKCNRNKLKETDVIEIRNSKDTQISLAKKYNVSRSAIYQIKKNNNWRYL